MGLQVSPGKKLRKEKEMRRLLLGLALVAITATAANATTFVWWEMESSNCEATAVGGEGQTLVIEKPLLAPAGFYEFQLVMKMRNNSTGTSGLTGYGTSLWMPPEDVGIKTFSGPFDPNNPSTPTPIPYFGDESTTGLLNPLAWTGSKSGNVNVGQKILDNYGRKRASGQAAFGVQGVKDWIRFTLRINVPNEPYSETEYLYQSVGAALYASTVPTQTVVFGPNTAVPGGTMVDDWATVHAYMPVIQIHAIPEPATLALFGLGLLGLIRRR
jgi:hypothetical protein